MELKLLPCLLLYGHLYITHCEFLHVRQREGNIATLHCGKLTKGNVTWSRDVSGQRVDILTTRNGETTKHIADPGRRYGSGADLVLSIFRVSQSDAGRYYCSGATVELTVTSGVRPSPLPVSTLPEEDSGGVSVVEPVLMFGGVGLAALMFLLATVAAGRVILHQAWLAGWTAGKEAVQLSPSE
ncbi:hypothetical protein AOLI_G00187850 [Acnodon oligacanthus]